MMGALPFTHLLPRLNDEEPHDLKPVMSGQEVVLYWAALDKERICNRTSWPPEFSESCGNAAYTNPLTGCGPIETRTLGEYSAHQALAGIPAQDGLPDVAWRSRVGCVAASAVGSAGREQDLVLWPRQLDRRHAASAIDQIALGLACPDRGR